MRTRPFLHEYLLDHLNPVIRWLIIGDVLYYAGVGLLGPIFALFIVDFIEGGNIEVAGIAIAIYLITKSVFQTSSMNISVQLCELNANITEKFLRMLLS